MKTEEKIAQTYRCPVCQGKMIYKSGGQNFLSFVCEICEALLMVVMRDKAEKISLGNDINIVVEDEEVAKILKRRFEK